MSKEGGMNHRIEIGKERGETRKEGSIFRIEEQERIQEEGRILRGIIGMTLKIQEIFQER